MAHTHQTINGARVALTSDEKTEWNNREAAYVSEKADYDAKAYQRNRVAEYPSIGDQLDMIYHNGDGGATFQAAIKAVKDKYPKE